MAKKYKPISLKDIKTCKLKSRKSKVQLDKVGKPFCRGSFSDFLSGLPDILAAKDFKAVVNAIISARKKDRPVILGMGAHPIKVGLSPIIINLIENKMITAVAMNGACIVHDFEMSLIGHTSEDVDIELCRGTFGMAEETGRDLNRAINEGVKKGYGIGKAVGEYILKSKANYKELSIIAAAERLNVPATVHVAVGTDIIHMHPAADGKSIGEGSMKDFRLFSSVVSDLKGGVYINLGSAVIMPEVFLKAIAVTRNLKYDVKNFTTVNMDFIQHYRTRENVLRRPVLSGGKSYALTGHHEIMFPLLAAAVMEKKDETRC
ncbi:MAG: deoxyhypusine synthase family protein [Nitrospirae bacterium]|nr:deoxyhypusine synthase family protein [Nitrospirota bacterium]